MAPFNPFFDSEKDSKVEKERNLPYQDTFDNWGTDMNEPLASSRYKNIQNWRNDSVSTERSNERPKRFRHHRNISHASFPSEDSDEEKGICNIIIF